MAYVINRWDGQAITTIEDGTVDTSLDIKLIGKNYAGYGEIQNENFVHMLENFAGNTQPSSAVRGQIWYDTASKKIKFYTGDQVAGTKVWKIAGGVEYGTEPSNPTEGDLWFDTSKSQLKVRSSTSSWLTIGPQSAGAGTTQLVSRTVDSSTGPKSIIAATINDQIVYVISKEEFVLTDTAEDLIRFKNYNGGSVKQGLTLPYTNSFGVAQSGSNHVYWGTARNAECLGGIEASAILNDLSNIGAFDDTGFTLGNDQDLKVYIEAGINPVIENQEGETLTFRVTQGTSTSKTPLVLTINAVEPGVTEQYTLGTVTKKWSNVHATTFTGTATQAQALQVDGGGGAFRTASTFAGANTIAARDSGGNLTAGIFSGVATSARYADLAEKYLPDQSYEPGTVVTIGGSAEVRSSNLGDRALGAVSTNPAFMMNKNLEGGIYIALKGRVPVKVMGTVEKGDRLIAGNDGYAQRAEIHQYHDVFAIALESKEYSEAGSIECVIL